MMIKVLCVLIGQLVVWAEGREDRRGLEFQAAKIIGGNEVADNTKYPWFVLPGPDSNICGGSLLHHSGVILTAAHCFTREGSWNSARVGATSLNGASFNVREYVIHPNYTGSVVGTSAEQDLALIKLDVFTTTVFDIVTLNADPAIPADGAPVTIMGLGITENLNLANVIREVTTPKSTDAACSESFSIYSNETMVCAGQNNVAAGSCVGDSGGPLVLEGTNIQVGVVSFGASPCDGITVYARVSSAIDWINEQACAWTSDEMFCGTEGETDSPTSSPISSPTASPMATPTTSPQASPTSTPNEATTSTTAQVSATASPSLSPVDPSAGPTNLPTSTLVFVQDTDSPTPGATESPSRTAFTDNKADLTILVQFDAFPEETTFSIFVPDSGLTILSGPDYNPAPFEKWNTTLSGLDFGDYRLIVEDSGENGLSSGESFEGSVQLLVDGFLVAKVSGDFGKSSAVPFSVEAIDPENPPIVPTPSPTANGDGGGVEVQIQYDGYPQEINWSIHMLDGVNIYDGPEDYRPEAFQKWTTRFEAMPPGKYKFVLKDSMGDGLKTGDFTGFVRITQKRDGKESLLKKRNGKFRSNKSFYFTVE